MINRKITYKLFRLMVGLYIFSIGIVMTINANLGLAPWDVLHQGIAKHAGMTIGEANILVGIAIIFINFFFKEKVGIGSLGNMYFVGVFIDQLMTQGWIPVYDNLLLQFSMMFAGMVIIAFGSYLYIGSGLGSGPRDALMVVLHTATGKSVGFVRNAIEIACMVVGMTLGGSFGIGTIIMATTIGFFIQIVFKLLKFDIGSVEHIYLEFPKQLIPKKEKC